ncbi:MAG: redoxin domain-containing protein [Gemmataceae bacterium]
MSVARRCCLLACLALLLPRPASAQMKVETKGLKAGPIEDATFVDEAGTKRSLRDWKDRKALVVVFLSFECPVSNSYAQPLADLFHAFEARGVAFVGLCPRDEGDEKQIAKLARDFKIPFQVFRDRSQEAARALGARVTPEAFLLDSKFAPRYRGRIDDGYTARLKPSAKVARQDLREAIEEVLAGKVVRAPATEAIGCPIEVVVTAKAKAGAPAYHRDVAPLLQTHW